MRSVLLLPNPPAQPPKCGIQNGQIKYKCLKTGLSSEAGKYELQQIFQKTKLHEPAEALPSASVAALAWNSRRALPSLQRGVPAGSSMFWDGNLGGSKYRFPKCPGKTCGSLVQWPSALAKGGLWGQGNHLFELILRLESTGAADA